MVLVGGNNGHKSQSGPEKPLPDGGVRKRAQQGLRKQKHLEKWSANRGRSLEARVLGCSKHNGVNTKKIAKETKEGSCATVFQSVAYR